jgi:hypothetical protein
MTTRPDTQPAAYTPESGAPVPERASVIEDFIDVFYAPAMVFGRRENAGFWPYFLIIAVAGAVFTLASRSLMSAAMDGDFSRRIAEQMAKNPQITQDVVNAQRGVSEGIGMFAIYMGMPVLLFLVGVLVWVASRVVGAKLTFGRSMLVSCIAQIPRLLGALFTAIYGLLLSDTSAINGMTRLTYSPARFLDPDTTNAGLLAVLARFDLFTLWVTVLLGIGIAVIAKVPRARGYAAAALIWAVPTLIAGVGALLSG